MKIKSVTIKNFLTIGSAEINLDDRGLLLIQGKNEDDSSADSNGAGKSSIADAVCWALYGVTARGVSTDAVVNKTAKKDCSVMIDLTDGKDRWQITRYRKHGTYKNQTLVLQADPNPACIPVDLHKGTERETQEVIDAIIGCSLDVFQAAVYAGQEKMPDLPAMTDKQLKAMIEEAAGTEVLSRAYALARERFNEFKAKHAASAASLETAGKQYSSLASQAIDENTRHADHEAKRKPLAKDELAKTLALSKQKKQLEAKVTLAQAVDRDAELVKITATFASLKGERDEADRLDKAVLTANGEYGRLRTLAEVGKRTHTAAVEALRTVSDKVGKPCDECGKPYHTHDLSEITELRKKDMAASEASLRSLVDQLKKALAAYKDAQERATAYKAGMTDVTELAKRQQQLQAELKEIEEWGKDAESVQAQIDRHVACAKTILDGINPHEATRALLAKQIDSQLDVIGKAEVDTDEFERLMQLHESATKVYGPAGVRAHILDNVTPYLNARTADYLATLADGNIKAVWNTLSANAKGEIKEKFCIEVTNDKGAESFEGLSGGEKRKVRLSCCMALQDLVASRATKPIDLFIADEVDHALDESGLERLMTVLNEKAKERGTVLVISHNSLGDWVDNVITITKKGGYGQVSGAH